MKQFYIGDILTVTTGRTVCDRGVEGVNDLLNFLTNDQIFIHQLSRVEVQCKPYLLDQFPQLKEITGEDITEENWRVWMEDKISRFGMNLDVIPLPEGVHEKVDPVAEMIEMRNGKNESVAVLNPVIDSVEMIGNQIGEKVSIAELQIMNIEIDQTNHVQLFEPWDQVRRDSLLNSIFHGKKIGKIIIDSKKNLFDGRQILLTIYEFLNDKYSFQGKLYSEWGIEQQIIFKAYLVDLVKIPNVESSNSLIYTQINPKNNP